MRRLGRLERLGACQVGVFSALSDSAMYVMYAGR